MSKIRVQGERERKNATPSVTSSRCHGTGLAAIAKRSAADSYDAEGDRRQQSGCSSAARQTRAETHACSLDRLGEPMPSVPGKRVLDRNTYGRLKAAAVVVSAAERRAAVAAQVANDERLKAECKARTEALRKHDPLRSKGPKLAQLDSEAQKKTSYLLNRAFEIKQDQEEEIKHCNSLILGTKCHVIRRAQIVEKELIQKEKKQEDRRMEKYMEQQRMLAAKAYKKAEEAERLKRKLQAMEIIQQMKENEMHREDNAAKAAEDARNRKEAAVAAQLSEIKGYHETLKKQAEMRKEFLQINTQLREQKDIEKERVKVEILQIQEYERQKNEREMAFEEEMKKLKNSKEKEIAKIQANQKASLDLQAAKDELNALRAMDKVEREWRKKERDEALKKIKDDQDLKDARLKQVEGRRRNSAIEIQRENDEFNKIIKLNIEDNEKLKEIEEQNKIKIEEHRKDLLKQVTEKEKEKIHQRKIFFHEGVKYQEDEAARKKALHDTMQKKMEGLKVHNFPTEYIQGIERQLKIK